MPTLDQRKAAVLDRLDVAGLVSELFDRRTPAGANQVLVLCPVHQESTPSCSVNTDSGLWNCKACAASGNVFDLLMAARGLDFAAVLAELERRCGIEQGGGSPRKNSAALPPKKSATKATPKKAAVSSPRGPAVAVFRYHDENNNFCYQKTRFEPGRDDKPKEYGFEHANGEGFAPGRGPHPPLLYGLFRLATAPENRRVFVVEGEGKADALAAWGEIAVCTDSGAAGRWPVNYNHFFTGRTVVLMPDNDGPGEKYAAKAAAALEDVAASISMLRLPDLPEKGDVLDWIAARRAAGLSDEAIKAEFLHLAANACEPWRAPAESLPLVIPPDDDETDDSTPERSRRGAARLLPMLTGCSLMIDPGGQTFIQFEGELFALDAKNPLLIEAVAESFYRATGEAQTMGKDALAAAVAVLSRRARLNGTEVPMANRCAPWGAALYYDLGNGRAVKIEGGKWTVVDSLPGLFRPWQHKRPHPEPTGPGNAERLFEFVNVSPDDRPLALATLAAAMVPGVSRPALVVTGPQGSGKSTAARFFKLLLDPAAPLLTMLPRKPEDLDLLLARASFLALDNLSSMPPDIADTLAAVITGAAPQRRKLHTDAELLTVLADVCLCFTSINRLSDRPDFLERTLRLALERIEDNNRLADDELDNAFAAAVPEILGGLLTLLARGLELLPNYRPERLPRMATFARIAAAIAEAAEPGAGGQYLAAFFKNQGAQHLELAETDLLFSAIAEACRNGEPPAGGFKEVCGALREIADPGPKDRFPSAHTFRRALERLRVPLDTAGIGFEFDGHRTANAKAHVRFFTRATSADLATGRTDDTPPFPPEPPPELAALIFDVGELDP
ncbi:MAG: hypothetical protein JXR59_06170 [Desulfuromonadaceae bacterium]|nr:hypothetical protein [Desulfuromonadaceae bacterium]